jgi:hypothetical protein
MTAWRRAIELELGRRTWRHWARLPAREGNRQAGSRELGFPHESWTTCLRHAREHGHKRADDRFKIARLGRYRLSIAPHATADRS